MEKYIGTKGILPVMPVSIIATEWEGKVNFAPHGQIGTVNDQPSVIYTSVIKEHKTAQNILKSKRFSVNIPHVGMLGQLKYCGSRSGAEADKSEQFDTFHGGEGVPMVKGCPVCFVCKLVETVEIHGSYLFLGEVLETYAEQSCLDGNLPDIRKAEPILCSLGGRFWAVGDELL